MLWRFCTCTCCEILNFTEGAISLAESRPESVVGVVCRNRLSTSPGLIHMTPGNS